jgi:hypothetical protein
MLLHDAYLEIKAAQNPVLVMLAKNNQVVTRVWREDCLAHKQWQKIRDEVLGIYDSDIQKKWLESDYKAVKKKKKEKGKGFEQLVDNLL